MHLRTTIGSLLIVLCLGGSSYPVASSISVTRDVPVFYQAIHIHSTERPIYKNILPEFNLKNTTPFFNAIQYAPMIVESEEKNNVYSQAFIKNQNNSHLITNRENKKNYTKQLEPREYNNNKIFGSTTSVPVPAISGYNIDLSSLNKAKHNNKTLLQQLYSDNQVTKLKKSPVLNLNIDMKETLRSKTLRNIIEKSILRDGKSIKTVQVLLAMENAQIQPALEYAKMPYLHLNVARSFNIARTPYKAQENEYNQKNKTRLESNSFFYSIPNIKYGFL